MFDSPPTGTTLHMKENIKYTIFILNSNPKARALRRVICLTWYQSLVWHEVLRSSQLSTIYSPFADLEVHRGLTLFGLFDSPHTGTRLHMRENIKDMLFLLNPNPKARALKRVIP